MKPLALALLLLAGLWPSSAAATDATVHLQLSAGAHLPAGVGTCAVLVPSGSSGVTVLAAAKANGCIDDYAVQTGSQYGSYLRCVTPHGGPEVCDTADGLVAYWNVFVNDVSSAIGIDDTVHHGDELELTYTTANCWVNAC